MSNMLPYQLLLETKGINAKDLSAETKAKIKKIESTIRGVANFGKKDENGDYIVGEATAKKISDLDKEIVEGIWDYIDSKNTPAPNQEPKKEPNAPAPNEEPKNEPNAPAPNQEPKKEEKKESVGRIGFFEF